MPGLLILLHVPESVTLIIKGEDDSGRLTFRPVWLANSTLHERTSALNQYMGTEMKETNRGKRADKSARSARSVNDSNNKISRGTTMATIDVRAEDSKDGSAVIGEQSPTVDRPSGGGGSSRQEGGGIEEASHNALAPADVEVETLPINIGVAGEGEEEEKGEGGLEGEKEKTWPSNQPVPTSKEGAGGSNNSDHHKDPSTGGEENKIGGMTGKKSNDSQPRPGHLEASLPKVELASRPKNPTGAKQEDSRKKQSSALNPPADPVKRRKLSAVQKEIENFGMKKVTVNIPNRLKKVFEAEGVKDAIFVRDDDPEGGHHFLVTIPTTAERAQMLRVKLIDLGVGVHFGTIAILPLEVFRTAKSNQYQGYLDLPVSPEHERVVRNALESAKNTIDFRVLTVVASTLSATGLATNNTVVIVASMLVSPLMGPIVSMTFGTIIANWDMVTEGLVSELVAFLLCFVSGVGVAAIFAYWGEDLEWPTIEMESRGIPSGLLIGILIAVPSGVGVALSALSNNTASLVGVAISAALLPPAVNVGMCYFYALFQVLEPSSRTFDRSSTDFVVIGTISFCLYVLNIICIYFAAIVTFKRGVREEEVADPAARSALFILFNCDWLKAVFAERKSSHEVFKNEFHWNFFKAAIPALKKHYEGGQKTIQLHDVKKYTSLPDKIIENELKRGKVDRDSAIKLLGEKKAEEYGLSVMKKEKNETESKVIKENEGTIRRLFDLYKPGITYHRTEASKQDNGGQQRIQMSPTRRRKVSEHIPEE
eukprot:jgi/Bigna1/90780/estExt_fgenesh1_pg.C_790038